MVRFSYKPNYLQISAVCKIQTSTIINIPLFQNHLKLHDNIHLNNHPRIILTNI